MSENFGYIDIILLAVMAGFILLRLRSTFGKGADNMPMKARFTHSQNNEEFVKTTLQDEPKQDESKFNEKTFIKGAEAAYEIIINAFASGNRKILKPLLTKDLFKSLKSIFEKS